jgi:hypothetical protein
MRIDVRAYASRRTINRMRATSRAPVRLDLRLQLGDLLLGGNNGVGTGALT